MTRATLKQNRAQEVVLDRIQRGDYLPGQRLPSERELAQDLGMSSIAIRRGLQKLAAAGLIVRRPRVGAFVRETQPVELSTRMAIVVPHYMGKGHPFLPILMGGMLAGLDQRECTISLFTFKEGAHFWRDAGEAMQARGINGAVIFTSYYIPLSQLEKLEQSDIKAVLLNTSTVAPRSKISTISIDLVPVMREAIQRLVDLGHRRILWMSYHLTVFREVEEQLVAEFSQKYHLENPERILHRLNGEPSEFEGWEALLSGPDRPTAIILQDEFMAHEVYRACHRLGLSIPGDLSVVATADAMPRSYTVPLSAPDTVMSWTNAAHRAAEHVRYMTQTNDNRIIEVTHKESIQWRASTDKPYSA